jgi:small subunit ribosomal protein S16
MKHLLRGVKLGLFDEATAMQKFEVWNASHEILVADRQDSHKKAKASSRIQPTIKKVEIAVPVAEAPAAVEAPEVEETPEVEAPVAVVETPEVEAPVVEAPVVEAEAPAVEAEAPAADTEAPAAE